MTTTFTDLQTLVNEYVAMFRIPKLIMIIILVGIALGSVNLLDLQLQLQLHSFTKNTEI